MKYGIIRTIILESDFNVISFVFLSFSKRTRKKTTLKYRYAGYQYDE